MTTITPTEHAKREWSRFALAAERAGWVELARTLHAGARVLPGKSMDLRLYDALQAAYRDWLVYGRIGWRTVYA